MVEYKNDKINAKIANLLVLITVLKEAVRTVFVVTFRSFFETVIFGLFLRFNKNPEVLEVN